MAEWGRLEDLLRLVNLTSGMLINLSKPWGPQLLSGDPCFIGLVSGLTEITLTAPCVVPGA